MKNKKRIVLMLSMALALGTITNTYAENFKVQRVYGIDNKVDYLKNHNFVKGYEDGDLKLDKGIKRSEITKLLVYANDGENIAKNLEKIQGSYKDVEINHWANGVINAATQNSMGKNGLFMINGYPDATFKPEKEITYAELSKMLVVLADDTLTKEDIKNADANWPSEWIKRAENLGIFEDLTFADVNKTVNREDAFTMFYNALEKEEIKTKEDKKEANTVKENTSRKKRKHKSNSSNKVEDKDHNDDKDDNDKNDKNEISKEEQEKINNQNKLVETTKAGVESAVKEGSLKDYFKDEVSYNDEEKIATVTIKKDSKISELPQNNTKLVEALKAGIDLDVMDKLEISLDGENSFEIAIKDKDISEIKTNIENEENFKQLLNSNLSDLKDKEFVFKASGKKLGEVKYTVKFEDAIVETIEDEKNKFHEDAKADAEALAEKENIIESIDYEKGKANVKLNMDKLEDINDIKSLGSGLFSKILPDLGVESVKIGDKDYVVDPSSKDFKINDMVNSVISELGDDNNIKYSAKINRNNIEFEEHFDVTFELLGSEETKTTNNKTLNENVQGLAETAIKFLNQQKRFELKKISNTEMEFTFLTKGNPGGFLGTTHDKTPATADTPIKNYTRGSGLATVLGKDPRNGETSKAQNQRINTIKTFVDLDTMTLDGEKFEGIKSMSELYKMNVGDLLGDKVLKVKIKDTATNEKNEKDKYLEYTIHFKLAEEKQESEEN